MTDHSQHGEQDAILSWAAAAGQTGSFVDVGAYDGKTNSNTLALAERGWSGVCIEPAPDAAQACAQLYADNDNVLVLPFALTADNDRHKVFWWTPGRMQSSLLPGRVKDTGANAIPIIVAALHPADLIRIWSSLPQPIFLSVDAEGISQYLARAMLDWIPASCVCVETEGDPPLLNEWEWAITYSNETNVVATYKGRRQAVLEWAGDVPRLDEQLATADR